MLTKRTSVLTRFLALTMGLVLASAVLVLAAPGADAQSSQPEFSTDFSVAFGDPCPAGSSNVGSFELEFFAGTWCRPKGYGPGIGEAACETVPFGVQFWPVTGPCWWTGFPQGLDTPCPAPTIRVIGTGDLEGVNGCVNSVLRYGINTRPVAEPVCINSDAVQNNEDLADESVGHRFEADDKLLQIVTGASCDYGCVSGFDMNCDGKLGDFCAIEIDRNTVKGAKDCLAALADG